MIFILFQGIIFKSRIYPIASLNFNHAELLLVEIISHK